MTTLPQTTGLRLPRPAGNGYAMTAPSMPQLHSTQAPAAGLTPADIWRVIRGNIWIILIAVFLSGVLGYGTNWFLARNFSRFTTAGLVQVEPPRIYDVQRQENRTISDYTSLQVEQRSQAQTLTHDSLISRVLQDPNAPIRNTKWFKQFIQSNGLPDIPKAKADLSDKFTANPIPDSKLITVSMTCADPDDAKTIVLNIVDRHVTDEKTKNFNLVDTRTRMLNSILEKHRRHLRDLKEKQGVRMTTLNIGAIGTPGRYTATDLELQRIINEQITQQGDAVVAKSYYDNIVSQLDAGIDPPTVEAMVDNYQMVISYRDRVLNYDSEILAATSAGRDSRTIREMEIKRDYWKVQLENMITERKVTARQELRDDAQSKFKAAQDSLDTTNKRIEELKGKLGDMALQMSEYLTATEEIESTSTALKDVSDQIDALTSNGEVESVSWASRPEKPDAPSFPKLGITMSVAIVLGLMLSLGVAFARELLDTSVRSPRDIARVGQMNLLGMLPHEDDDLQSAGTPLPLVIYQAPTSLMAEHYRQVRTRLQHATSLDTTRSMLITSPGPGDGKTTVACNLAAGLALNGRKILLVDANFRRPELNRVFNIANDAGFGNVLSSIDQFEASIKPTSVPNLDVLPTGPKPTNPTELLESQLLTDFIERALEEYDHVIFDTGPLLLVSETAALAPRVDGVITVVRARSNSRGVLQRLRDALRQLKAEHLGVVLNGVRSQGGGYYGRNMRTYYEYSSNSAA